MREQRRTRLAHSHQAGHGARRRSEHAVADPAGSRHDRAERQAWIQHGIIHLGDDVCQALVGDRGARAAGGE